MNQWTTKVIELDDGELAIDLPEDMLKQLNWTEGTVVEWVNNKDGSWSLVEKKNERKYYYTSREVGLQTFSEHGAMYRTIDDKE